MTDAPASFVWTSLIALVVIYALIAFFFVTLLIKLAERWKREDSGVAAAPEMGVPYGPRSVPGE